ncbi:MAG: diguanylate cyclase [Cyanobacteria bacterium P01_H01_bin.162]
MAHPCVENHFTTISAATPLPKAIQKLTRLTCELQPEASTSSPASSLLVVQQEKLIGIVTERDLIRQIATQSDLSRLTIEQVMTTNLITRHLDDLGDAFELMQIMRRHRIRHLPIIDAQKRPIGLVTPKSVRAVLMPADLLRYRLVQEIMTPKVITANGEASLAAIAQQMATASVSCVVIVREEAGVTLPIGILTERDVVQFQALELDFAQTQAAVVMSAPVFGVSPQDSVWEVHKTMETQRIRRVVVVNEQQHLVGIITQTSILGALDPLEMRHLIEDLESKIQRLRDDKTTLLKQQHELLSKKNQALQMANRELNRLSNLDGLTQIPNRRCFDDRIQQEWRRLQREQQPLSVILGDIDNFKAVNDTYGHLLGDDCLKAVAMAMSQVLKRPDDFVARYGGEEFVVVLPNTDQAGAVNIVQQLQQAIANIAPVSSSSPDACRVTMSFGVTTLVPTSSLSCQKLLTLADQALYTAKANGRDRYHVS